MHEKHYVILGKILCHGQPVPQFIWKTIERDDNDDDVREYTGTDGLVNINTFDWDGFFNYDLELELHIPFECDCKSEFFRNIGTDYQFDTQREAQAKPYDFGVIELSSLC
uniref:Transthyretin-like family protein n=1 Tax=Panagrellus redivivus TaxID=6233 RepID=A0A7E4ZZ07_PANRE